MARASSGPRGPVSTGRRGPTVQVQLPGQRIPNPGAWRGSVFGGLIAAVVVSLVYRPALAWAQARVAADAARDPGAFPLSDPTDILAWAILHVYPSLITPLRLLTAAVLMWVVVELALLALMRIRTARAMEAEARQGVGVSLLMRLPPPTGRPGGGSSSSAADVGDELFDSLHSALRAWVSVWGTGPRLGFSMVGRPQTPAQLLVWMPEAPRAIGTHPPLPWWQFWRTPPALPASQATPAGAPALPPGDGPMANRLRPILEGVIPGTRADRVPDPLRAAIAPGKHLHWAEVTLRTTPDCPLRMHDNLEHDLLGPLANAHRARPGTDLVTLQVVMQPLRHILLREEWRGQIMRRLMQLEHAYEHRLEGDTLRLQAKLAGAPYLVTIRAIAIGDDPESVAQDLESLLATLEGQYRQTTGDREQRLTRRDTHQVVVPERWDDLSTPLAVARMTHLLIGGAMALGLLLGMVLAPPLTPLLRDAGRAVHAAVPDVAAALARYALPLEPRVLLAAALASAGGLLAATTRRLARRDVAREQIARLLVRWPRAPLPPRVLLPSLTRYPQTILTAREVEGLWNLPSAALSGSIEYLPNRYIPPPAIAFCNNEPDRVPIGMGRRADGSYAPVGPTLRDLRNIMHMTAAMGTGKSRLLTNLCYHLMRMPLQPGFGLIDGKGDDQGALAATVLKLLPLEAESRLMWVDLLDLLNPIGLNPLATDGSDRNESMTLSQLLVMFARLDPTSWSKSHGMEQYAQQAGLLVLEAVDHPTLAHFKQALLNETYRAELLRKVRNPEVRSFWLEVFPNTGETQKASRDALIRRVDKLLVTPMLRNIFTRPVPTLNVREAIESRRIVLIQLPAERLGEQARGIGSLLIREIVKGAFARSGDDLSRADWPLIVDELQVLIDPMSNVDLETVLTRFRALGVPGIYAHQTLSQLGELANEMVGNVLNHIILRASEPDASFYAKLYAAQGITPADISGQPALEHQYADLVCRGQPTRLFSLQPLMWPESPTIELPEYAGPGWRTITAPAQGKTERMLDALIDRMALLSNAPRFDPLEIADHLAASLSDEEWTQVKERWAFHRQAQAEHILANPGCVTDHTTRRKLLSGLRFGEPRLSAIIDYLRVRQALVTPVVPGVGAGAGRGRGRGRDRGAGSPPAETRTYLSHSTEAPRLSPDDHTPPSGGAPAAPAPGAVQAAAAPPLSQPGVQTSALSEADL